MATVVAAVDLARVRLPLAEEEEAAEAELRLQKEITTEKRVLETKVVGVEAAKIVGAEPAKVVGAEPAAPDQLRVQVSQVRNLLDSSQPLQCRFSPLCRSLQIQRTAEVFSHVDAPSAPAAVPHFTVSKVSVPKHEASHEVRSGAAARVTLTRAHLNLAAVVVWCGSLTVAILNPGCHSIAPRRRLTSLLPGGPQRRRLSWLCCGNLATALIFWFLCSS